MVNLTFVIDKSNVDKKGYSPIKANITINYQKRRKTVEKIKAQYWNKKKQRVNKPKPHEADNDFEAINDRLKKLQDNAKEYFKLCKRQNIPITLKLAEEFLNGKTILLGDIDFWSAYDQFLKLGKQELSYNTNRNRKTVYNKIKDFETDTGYKLTWQSIDLVFWDKLKIYILGNPEYSYNYLSAIADKFKAFMRWSMDRRYHQNLEFTKFSAPEKEISHVSLTWDELKTLINYNFDGERLRKTRDFFCFGCLTGQRYSDLSQLTKDNIVNDTIIRTQEKTDQKVVIPIFPELRTIISRYSDQYMLLPKISNQKLNEYIKECCRIAEIKAPTEWKTFTGNETKLEIVPKSELIGSHTARKTFICLAHEKGMDLESIKSITGIREEKTLRRYLEVSAETKKQKLISVFQDI